MFEKLFNGVRQKQVCPSPRNTDTTAHATPVERPRSTQSSRYLDQDADKYGLSDRENSWIAAIM